MNRKDLTRRKQNGEVVLSQSQTFSGPLPHPDILVKYNDSVANGAERIMAMAENQAAHRMKLEEMVIQGNISAQSRGSIFAFVLGLIGIGGGIWLIGTGRSTEGLTSLIASLATLLSIFVIGRYKQEKERRRKANEPQSD